MFRSFGKTPRIQISPQKTAGNMNSMQEFGDDYTDSESSSPELSPQTLIQENRTLRRRLYIAEEKAEAREQLLIQAQELLTLTESQASFVSHEVRNCLQNILASITDLEEIAQNLSEVSPNSPNTMGAQISRMQNTSYSLLISVKDAIEITNNQLDWAKLQAGKMEFTPYPLQLKECLDEILLPFKAKAAQNNLTLELVFPPRKLWIMSNHQAMARIFKNFISNALKFTPPGGRISLIVDVVGESANSYKMNITVKDTGIGMKQQDAEKLFQQFVQVHDTNDKDYGGTGLGLLIAKTVVNQMRGNITIKTKEKVGTSFIVSIPFPRPTPAQMLAILHQPSDKSKIVPSNKPQKILRILAVDDTPVNIKIAARIITQAKHEPLTAGSSEEAIQVFTTNNISSQNPKTRIDVILMDMIMPGTDGAETVKKIRELEALHQLPPCYIIFLSGNNLKESEERDKLPANVNDCLLKPLTMDSLIQALAKHPAQAPATTKKSSRYGLFTSEKSAPLSSDTSSSTRTLSQPKDQEQQKPTFLSKKEQEKAEKEKTPASCACILM